MRKLFASIFILAAISASAQSFGVTSPDGRQSAEISVSSLSGVTRVCYETSFCGRQVVETSALDLEMDNHIWELATGKRSLPKLDRWMDNLELSGTEVSSRDTTWHNAFGERSTVHDAYNGIVCTL